MEKQKFYDEVIAEIKDQIPESFKEHVLIDVREINKTNDEKKMAVSIRLSPTGVAPMLYLDEFYEEYSKTCELDRSVFSIYSDAVKAFKLELENEDSSLKNRIKNKEIELSNIIIDINKEVLMKNIAFFVPNYCKHKTESEN